MSASFLAGYSVNNNEARGALRELRRKGFCRAAFWMAMARKGDGERAVKVMCMLNPIEHGRERGVAWVEIDGQRICDGVIPLERGLVKHKVLVRMGDPV